VGNAGEDEANLDALMARLADGDRSAFDPLFRVLHPRAVRLAKLRLADADALDAAQSALEKVFARASEFTPGRPVLPWFYAIAANEVHGSSRRAGVANRREGGALEVIAAGDDPEQALGRAELRAAVAEAIDLLDPASTAAIAALLGDAELPAAATAAAQRKRVSRAYARLRHLLGRFHER
jgi:RNA polymerase sigma-70 factor (ECF subfamily)